MSKPTLSLGINKKICDAEGCSAKATKEIKISVGQMGDIELSICSNCVSKFVVLEEKTKCSESLVSRHDQSSAYHRTNPSQDSDLND